MSIDTAKHHAQLLRALARELADKIRAEVHSVNSIEKLAYTEMVLDYLAGDLVVAPELLGELGQRYRSGIAAALDKAPGLPAAEALRAQLDAVVHEEGVAAQREALTLRTLAGTVIRAISDAGIEGVETELHALGQLDREWLVRFEAEARPAAVAKARQEEPEAPPASTEAVVTPEDMTAYLRERFPATPDLAVTEVKVIPGGRSKRTIALMLAGQGDLPAELIMRQDMTLKYAGQTIASEVEPLYRLDALGLPVPVPVWFEPERTKFGGPFFLTKLQRGVPPGDYFDVHYPTPGAIADLARALGKLHGTDPAALGIEVAGATAQQLFAERIEAYWQIWRTNSTRGSTLIDYAYAWAREAVKMPFPEKPVAVHGDVGAYNWLVEDDRLTVILDWEFVHAGDPSEDLGSVRQYAEAAMPWSEFMALYRAAGGEDVPEQRVKLAELMQWLKGTTLVATSARNFVEGGTNDFMKATNSFAGLRRIEMKIANALRDVL